MKYSIITAYIFAMLCGASAKAQTIKINHDLGDVPTAMVEEAAWAIQQRTGINLEIVGTSHVDCEYGHIIVRRASPAEWAGTGLPDPAYAFSSQCGGVNWGQVIWHPTKPFTMEGLRHELGHASGCWKHYIFESWHVMFSLGDKEFLTAGDLNCIKTSNWWPRSGGNECFVEVGGDMDLYIPSIVGLAVWLKYEGNNTWSQVRALSTPLSCSGNTLTGSVAEFDDIRSYGMAPLSYARLRNTSTGVWVLEAAR